MEKIDTIFEAASAMESTHIALCEIYDALDVFDDSVERELHASGGEIEDWAAINFARRYHIFKSTFRIVCRDLARVIDELKDSVDLTYPKMELLSESYRLPIGTTPPYL